MENKKLRAKDFGKTNKEKLLKRLQEYCKGLSADEKIKKRNYANNMNKNMT